MVAYRAEFIIWVLTTNMPLLMMGLWSAVAADAPVGRFGTTEFVAYYLGALIIRLVTNSWLVWMCDDMTGGCSWSRPVPVIA